jgi:hypothetical protein
VIKKPLINNPNLQLKLRLSMPEETMYLTYHYKYQQLLGVLFKVPIPFLGHITLIPTS